MANELKSCPFCGGNNLDTYYCDIEGWIAHIKCDDCDDMIGPMSEFKYETKEEAYEDASKRWNTRTAVPVEGLETWKFHAPLNGSSKMIQSNDGEWVPRSQAEAIIAAERTVRDFLIDGINVAITALDEQLETYHDHEGDTPQSASLRKIVHHLMGTTTDNNGDAMMSRITDLKYQLDIRVDQCRCLANRVEKIEANNAALTARCADWSKSYAEKCSDYEAQKRRAEALETQLAAMKNALEETHKAISEYYRYQTGGETRGSYDGKPERNALWKSMYQALAALEAKP